MCNYFLVGMSYNPKWLMSRLPNADRLLPSLARNGRRHGNW